ncbi:MAG TPA: trehalose-6-phosphate synthase [Dehalococcoidia bacterium]|nr:trehalose-6-phosphate synthase [Dehalococcoidia bacterium]
MATKHEGNVARLRKLCQEKLGQRNIILASNRGPFEYQIGEDGRLRVHRGSGGVVTALSSLSQYAELTWIASAMGEGDRKAAERVQGGHFRAPLLGQSLFLRFVVNPRNVYHKFYSIICNPLLWFLQHYLWNLSHNPNIDSVVYDAWNNGYVAVNRAFAQAILAEAGQMRQPPVVMLHDYHLYLTPALVRKEIPDLIIQHFTHIPWPTPTYWRLLPSTMRTDIIESLCAADIVGLQTQRDVQHFLYCCAEFLKEADVDLKEHAVYCNGHRTWVKSYPVSVDVTSLHRMVSSARVQEYERKLRSHLGEQTIVTVARAEPSKNIVRGFRAFHMLLKAYPEFLGRIKFLAFLVPTRTHLKLYQRYTQEITELVNTINSDLGTETWQPIEVFYENNYPQAIAAMRLYDVLLVNSVVDGMNLVAKEGPTVNANNGVIILSDTAGAWEEIGQHALSVAPADLEGTMQALHQALTMSPEEREARATALKQVIEEADITQWLFSQLSDLASLCQEQALLTGPEAPRNL